MTGIRSDEFRFLSSEGYYVIERCIEGAPAFEAFPIRFVRIASLA